MLKLRLMLLHESAYSSFRQLSSCTATFDSMVLGFMKTAVMLECFGQILLKTLINFTQSLHSDFGYLKSY